MVDLVVKLSEANSLGRLTQEAVSLSYGLDDGDAVSKALIQLHNGGEVDVIGQFTKVQRATETNNDLYSAMHVLERVIPKISADAKAVMDCVQAYTQAAGTDLAAGTLIDPLIAFFLTDLERTKEALQLISDFPGEYGSLLIPVLVSRSQRDIDATIDETVTLTGNKNEDIRCQAIAALGALDYTQSKASLGKAFDCLEQLSRKYNDDRNQSIVVRSTLRIYHRNDTEESSTIIRILSEALNNGASLSLHALAIALQFGDYRNSDVILDFILTQLKLIDPSNKGTVEAVGRGLGRLVKAGKKLEAIELIEYLLVKHSQVLSIGDFSHLDYEFSRKKESINFLVTRWLCSGQVALCDAVSDIVRDSAGEEELSLQVDPSQLMGDEDYHLVFMARKTIGFLFSRPVACANMVISLASKAKDKDTVQELGRLLFWPLLLNYGGKLREFLDRASSEASGSAKEAVDFALLSIDNYLGAISSVDSIPELYPSQSQREVIARKNQEQARVITKLARERSVFARLIPTKTLLYGRASIHVIQDTSGKQIRMVTPLKTIESSVEFPRQQVVDPFGLDYGLRIFRAERLVNR